MKSNKKLKAFVPFIAAIFIAVIALSIAFFIAARDYTDFEYEVELDDKTVASGKQVTATTFNNNVVVNQVEIIKKFNEAAFFSDEATRETMEAGRTELIDMINESVDLLPEKDEIKGDGVTDFYNATMQWYNFYEETAGVSLAEITEIWFKDPFYQEDYDKVVELIDAMNERIDEEDAKFEQAQKEFAEINDFELDVEIGD